MTDPTLVPVAVACPCPGAPHDGDTVYLRPKLSLHGGMVAQRKIIELAAGSADSDEIMASLSEVFCRYGVDSATFTDAEGDALSREEAVDLLLGDFTTGFPVGNEAADLYSEGLLDPLRAKVSKSSRATPINGSTSAPTTSSGTRPKRSKRSSTSTSQTDDTATT